MRCPPVPIAASLGQRPSTSPQSGVVSGTPLTPAKPELTPPLRQGRPTADTSLDPHETNEQNTEGDLQGPYDPPADQWRITPILKEERNFRHGGWHNRRQKVWSALLATGASKNRLDRFYNCGSACYVQYHPERKELRLVANYCRDRLCLPCANARASRIARNLRRCLHGKRVRFATLTLRHNSTPLSAQVDRLLSSFKLLRRRQDFAKAVDGGVAFLELKWKPTTKAWHPHLHLLIETRWLPQKELARMWHEITGDSYIVDVRAVRDQDEVTRYVTKYASKPLDASIFNEQTVTQEAVVALKGRRLCTTFGKWRGIKLEEREPIDDGWQTVGTLRQLIADARDGDTYAQSVLEALKRKQHLVELSFNEGPAPPPS